MLPFLFGAAQLIGKEEEVGFSKLLSIRERAFRVVLVPSKEVFGSIGNVAISRSLDWYDNGQLVGLLYYLVV